MSKMRAAEEEQDEEEENVPVMKEEQDVSMMKQEQSSQDIMVCNFHAPMLYITIMSIEKFLN